MTDIIFVIDISTGVELRIPGRYESKHFGDNEVLAAGVKLARALGGRFSHWEDAK